MAKYGKNNYFDGVILPEPKEEALRRMAKGVDASKGYLESTDAGLSFDGPRSMECFFNLRQSDGTQRPAQFSTSMIAIAVTPMDAIMFHCGNKSLQVSRVTIGNDIHAVISYDGATAMCYINGIKVGAMQPTAYMLSALFRIGDPSHITKSPIHFCRHFNYALSAEEVAALYNNGDPMGYVVPKAMRYFPDVSFLGPDGGLIRQSYTWTNSPEDLNFFRYNFKQDILLGQRLKVQITVSDYEAGYVQLDAAFRGEYYGQTDGIRANGTYVFITNALNSTAYTSYGRVWCVDEGQGRKCTVTVDSVEVVGLFAEYLPQNLIPTAEGSVVQWLDSAPQLPEANGILPPLDASVGGYDLAAIGNPKIII